MKVIVWAVRVVLFLVVLTFSVRNTDKVIVKWLPGLEVEVQLVVALLCALLLGSMLAWVSLLPSWIKAKRNASIAMKSLEKLEKEQLGKPTSATTVESSSPALPIGPADGI